MKRRDQQTDNEHGLLEHAPAGRRAPILREKGKERNRLYYIGHLLRRALARFTHEEMFPIQEMGTLCFE